MSRTATFLRRARALLGTWYAYMMAYRAEMFLWALAGSLPLIMMGVWMEAARSGAFPGTPVDYARYFLAVFLTRQLTVVWVIWNFEEQILHGGLAFRLLQPIDPVWHFVAGHVAERGARLPFVFVLTALFFALYPESFWWPSPGDLLAFLLACTAAFVLRFADQYTFSMLAFWTERASDIHRLWFTLYMFLSGLVAPLEVYPPAIRDVVLWTPFPYLVYVPSTLLTGGPVDVPRAALVFLAWGAFFVALNRVLWARGLRRFSAMGA